MKTLWALFIAGQILNAGNMNYQQEAGYYELNPIYGKHPSKEQVYLIKGAEIAAVYGLTKLFPKYDKYIVGGAATVTWGFIYYDTNNAGVEFKLRF